MALDLLDTVPVFEMKSYHQKSSQLDQLYHDMADGKLGVAATTGSWYVGITSVKTANPKT